MMNVADANLGGGVKGVASSEMEEYRHTKRSIVPLMRQLASVSLRDTRTSSTNRTEGESKGKASGEHQAAEGLWREARADSPGEPYPGIATRCSRLRPTYRLMAPEHVWVAKRVWVEVAGVSALPVVLPSSLDGASVGITSKLSFPPRRQMHDVTFSAFDRPWPPRGC